jgi:S1-C subfamily serine protease
MRAPLSSILLLLLVVTPAAAQPSVQEALLRSKPAVALVVSEVGAEITLRCGTDGEHRATPPPFRETGTGWFIDAGGWVITNAHVVSPAKQPGGWLRAELLEKAVRAECLPALLAARGLRPGDRTEVERALLREAVASVEKTAEVKLAPSITVLLSNGVRFAASVVKYSPPVAGESMSGRDLALVRIEAADMPVLPLSDSSAAKIGDPLHILGFPGVVLTHELLNASAKLEASVTNGAVSGFKQDVSGQPVIQTDAPAAWGNSGGPAVDDSGHVMGVLTFVTLESSGGGLVQGFNFVIPVGAIRDFLEGTGVPANGTGNFNAAWHGGLAEFFAGNHTKAAPLLREANRLLPELPDVRRITLENEDRIKHPLPRAFPWALVAIMVTAASGLVFGWLGFVRWKRNQFRIGPAEVARLLETSPEPPILLDVRNQETYEKSPVRLPRAHHVTPQELTAGATPMSSIDRDRMVVAYCT